MTGLSNTSMVDRSSASRSPVEAAYAYGAAHASHELINNYANTRILAFVRICGESEWCGASGANCYSLLEPGQLLEADNKVYILAGARLFVNSSKTFYLLNQDDRPIYQFTHSIKGTELDNSADGFIKIPVEQEKLDLKGGSTDGQISHIHDVPRSFREYVYGYICEKTESCHKASGANCYVFLGMGELKKVDNTIHIFATARLFVNSSKTFHLLDKDKRPISQFKHSITEAESKISADGFIKIPVEQETLGLKGGSIDGQISHMHYK